VSPASADFSELLATVTARYSRVIVVGDLTALLNGVDHVTCQVDVVADRLESESLHSPTFFALSVLAHTAVPFDDLWHHSLQITFCETRLRFASTPHLIEIARRDRAGVSPIFVQRLCVLDAHRSKSPPAAWGTFEDAETLRRWSFLQRTPEQRLNWLIDMLEIAYASGALKSRYPDAQDLK
jgi:hypothetical protein